jgi:hypothetical protein
MSEFRCGVVKINPLACLSTPQRSREILNRVHDISFKTALIREMRTIDRFNRLIDDGSMSGGKRMPVHLIEAEDLIRRIPWWSRPNSVGISCCVFTGWAATAPSNGFRPISIASALNRPSTSGQSANKRVMLCSVHFGLPIKRPQ